MSHVFFALQRRQDHGITQPKGTRMFQDTLALMPLWAFAGAIGVTLFAGFVKGATGFAMPLIMISGLSLFIDPLIAVAGIILPIVDVQRGSGLSLRARPRRVGWSGNTGANILIVCVTILIVAQFIMVVPTHVFYLILGVPVVILSLIQLFGVRFHIPESRRRLAEWGVGLVAGGLGGLTGGHGVRHGAVSSSRSKRPRPKQLLVQGVVYGVGSISLLAGHVQSGGPETSPRCRSRRRCSSPPISACSWVSACRTG